MAFPLLQVGTQLISQSPIPSTGPLPVMEHFQHRYCVSHVKTDHSVSVRRVLESYESVLIQRWWPDSRRVTDVDEQEPRTLRPQQVAIGAGGLIGNRSTLLPIVERTEGDVKASGKFFLRKAERAADQLDLRRAFHALEVGGRKRQRIGIVRGGGATLRFTHRIEPAPVVLRRLSRCLRGIVGVHAARLLGPI